MIILKNPIATLRRNLSLRVSGSHFTLKRLCAWNFQRDSDKLVPYRPSPSFVSRYASRSVGLSGRHQLPFLADDVSSMVSWMAGSWTRAKREEKAWTKEEPRCRRGFSSHARFLAPGPHPLSLERVRPTPSFNPFKLCATTLSLLPHAIRLKSFEYSFIIVRCNRSIFKRYRLYTY